MNALAVDPFFPDTLFAASAFGGVWVSRDGGATWRAARGFPSGSAFYPASVRSLAADPARPGEYYAGAADLGVFRSSNSGRLWKAEIQQGLTAGGEWAPLIHPAVPSTVYVIGAGGWLFRSADGGQSWERESNAPAWFDDVVLDPLHPEILYGFEITRDPVHPEEGYIGLSSRSNDGGATWTEVGAIPVGVRSVLVDPQAPATLYAVLPSQGISRSTDGGITWTWVGASLARVRRSGITDSLHPITAHTAAPHTIYVTPGLGGLFEARFVD